MCESTQELFLLEFLVDRVNIPSVQAIHDDILPVTTCIEFKILNLPPIYISQDGTNEKCTCLGEEPQIFRKGKSCLFALPKSLLQKPICSFPILLTVYKKLPPTVLPDVMTIGSYQIETRDMINCLLQECPDSSSKPCRTLKNKFRIATPTGQCVGEVGLFLRFSRLGRKVVTQFQNPHNRKPYLFKGTQNSPVFQCRRIPSQISAGPDCVCDKTQKLECKSEEQPAKTCCESAKPASQRNHGRKKRSGSRPCCPKSNKEHSTKFQDCPDSKNEKTRQCGCDVKEAKSFSCCK